MKSWSCLLLRFICHELLGEVAVQKVGHVPLLVSTIIRRMDDVAEDTEAQLLGLMSHYGVQSRLMSLLMLTRQQCMFLCELFFRRMCMKICCEHFCSQSTPPLQNYSSLWMITYQGNWIGRFVLVCAQMEWLPWLDGFLVSWLQSKRLLLNVSLWTVSSIEKCWLAKKCHLNLTTF